MPHLIVANQFYGEHENADRALHPRCPQRGDLIGLGTGNGGIEILQQCTTNDMCVECKNGSFKINLENIIF